jgi:hypothetical protein
MVCDEKVSYSDSVPSNPPFAPRSRPLNRSPLYEKDSKLSLWKTAINFPDLHLSWPDVRHKRILEEAPEQGDSAVSV